jgi:hypothetical protein
MGTDEGDITTITYPLAMRANIVRNNSSTLNSATIVLYNLSTTLRSKIIKARYEITKFSRITLYVNYRNENLTKVFVGNILEAYSYRSGNNIETKILAQDGGFAAQNANISQTFNSGFSTRAFVNAFFESFKTIKTSGGDVSTGLQLGKVGNVDSDYNFTKGVSVFGNSFSVLNKYFQNQVFIDNEVVNILKANEVFEAYVPLINSDTGLLDTPIIYNTSLDIKTLFDPAIVVGQIIEIQSTINPAINGQWKVQGVNHNISVMEGGEMQSTSLLNLFLGNAALSIISNQ